MLLNRSCFFLSVCSRVELICNRWHVLPLNSKLLVVTVLHFLHLWSSLIHKFLMRTCFPNVCHKKKCVCMCVTWGRRAKAEIRSLLFLLEALMEVLLVFPFCPTPPYRLSLCKCVCVQNPSFMTSVSKPQGLQFSEKTLIWSDRTASGALFRGDLHCGGDPRV